MGLDLDSVHNWIVDEVTRSRSISESMGDLIELCQSAKPHPDWERFLSLPFDDITPLLVWIQQPFQQEPPKRPLRGLWFGLFNAHHQGENVADLYLSGSERFDPDPRSDEWAIAPEWWPETRRAMSPLLADITRIAYQGGGLGNDAEYPVCLGYGTFVVRELLETIEPSLILGASEALGVAVGFDTGDFILLGEFSPNGLTTTQPV